METKTWKHGTMEAWRHTDMKTYRHTDIKRKKEVQAILLNLFTGGSFVRLMTKKQMEVIHLQTDTPIMYIFYVQFADPHLNCSKIDSVGFSLVLIVH
jgi:hypothetical protein